MPPPPQEPPVDMRDFTAHLSQAVSGAASVSEIEAWLRDHPSVTLVRTEEYLLKSFPPQRRFIVELSLAGARVPQAIDVYTFDDERFSLRGIHDA